MAGDPHKFRNIAFKDREFIGPYSRESILTMTEGLSGCALDIGCGNGSVLDAIGLAGIGIDFNPTAIQQAKARRTSSEFIAGDLQTVLRELHYQPDLVICLGASQAIGTARQALEAMSKMLRPGGHLLFGDGFWESEPSAEFRELLGGDLGSLEAFEQAGLPYGLVHSRTSVSTQADWDAFEDDYHEAMIAWCDAHLEDPDEPAFRERITTWRTWYLADGRGVLGFAMVLFQKQPAS